MLTQLKSSLEIVAAKLKSFDYMNGELRIELSSPKGAVQLLQRTTIARIACL